MNTTDRLAQALRDAHACLEWHYQNPHPSEATGMRQKLDASAARKVSTALAEHEAAPTAPDAHPSAAPVLKCERCKWVDGLPWDQPAALRGEPEAVWQRRFWRKKPVVIEAMRWDGTEPGCQSIKAVFHDLETTAKYGYIDGRTEVTYWRIRTLEGAMRVSPGDWIIRGVAGEFYPVKPDIFAATYEPAAPPQAASGGSLEDSKPRVTGSPVEIWLNYGDIKADCAHDECYRSGGVTWSQDKVFDSDVRYVLAQGDRNG